MGKAASAVSTLLKVRSLLQIRSTKKEEGRKGRLHWNTLWQWRCVKSGITSNEVTCGVVFPLEGLFLSCRPFFEGQVCSPWIKLSSELLLDTPWSRKGCCVAEFPQRALCVYLHTLFCTLKNDCVVFVGFSNTITISARRVITFICKFVTRSSKSRSKKCFLLFFSR